MMNRLPYSERVTMNTLTKMASGLISQWHPDPPKDDGSQATAMQLGADQQVLLAQTFGWSEKETPS